MAEPTEADRLALIAQVKANLVEAIAARAQLAEVEAAEQHPPAETPEEAAAQLQAATERVQKALEARKR